MGFRMVCDFRPTEPTVIHLFQTADAAREGAAADREGDAQCGCECDYDRDTIGGYGIRCFTLR